MSSEAALAFIAATMGSMPPDTCAKCAAARFSKHQRDQQQLGRASGCCRAQARARALQRVGVFAADDNPLVEIEPTIEDDHRRS